MGRGLLLGGQPRLHPKGEGSQHFPIWGFLSNYAYTLCCSTTNNRTLASMTEVWCTFGVTFCTGWMSLIASVSESASRCSSVSMGWHWTTCLLCATLYPDSLDARTFALRIADSSTSHALHCRCAVFQPSLTLVHLCGTLCQFISRIAIWLLQLLCAILSLISFLSTDIVSSAFGVWSHKCAI